MAPFKLYGDYKSQPVRAVALMLRTNNIDFDFVSCPLEPKAGRRIGTEEYATNVNPFKRVPTLVVEGVAHICESSAALQYLAELEGVSPHWYPRSGKERILVNTYLAWHGPDVRKYASGYFVSTFYGPLFLDRHFTDTQVKEFRDGFEALLDKLEKIWLKETPYLAGNDITIADLQLITELTQVESTGYDMVKGRPKLEAWMQLVKDILQPHYDAISEEPLTGFADQYKEYKASK
ncbi:unnamed protein product [Owenia fusiformis]|uniref:Uncharacterized protein n=1 Tax=Owenia fusiformis TaxID=6347 RepID=A0A8J1UAA1_OWEFU|nr:unnamed protein product [Owenia fusiformis]